MPSSKKTKQPVSAAVKSAASTKGSRSVRSKGKAVPTIVAAAESEDEISLDGGLDVADAVRKGMRSNNVRFENNFSDSSLLGCLCSIYWPGDDEWYSGRILLVSTDGNKCFVFYEDGMTEWVELSKHEMMIDAELGKVGNWAAYKVWVSPKAIEGRPGFEPLKSGILFAALYAFFAKLISLIFEGKIYISFLKEKKAEHGYYNPSEFTSFYIPRATDKALKNFKLAENEILVKRGYIEV